ncbi:MAG: hypothetical protein CLLPBCKN_006472 [Chroococcidiopsis cubana SAG 39.79]|nr:hypothetical protein [Chroococcidiopsis cubana SAG 39.79]
MRVLLGRLGNRLSLLSFPILGKPVNPSGLVHVDDGSNVDSLQVSHIQLGSTEFPNGFRVTAFYPCFTQLIVSRTHEGYAVTPAPGEMELS